MKSWTDELGGTVALGDYTWRLLALTEPRLDVTGTVDADGVLFACVADLTATLRPGRDLDFVVKATPVAGGDPIWLIERQLVVERTAIP